MNHVVDGFLGVLQTLLFWKCFGLNHTSLYEYKVLKMTEVTKAI